MEKKSITGGLGFIDVLQLIFITLKLCGVINWSWVVVLIPLWIGLGLIGLALIVLLVAWVVKLIVER